MNRQPLLLQCSVPATTAGTLGSMPHSHERTMRMHQPAEFTAFRSLPSVHCPPSTALHLQEVTVMFNLVNEPWPKYNMQVRLRHVCWPLFCN